MGGWIGCLIALVGGWVGGWVKEKGSRNSAIWALNRTSELSAFGDGLKRWVGGWVGGTCVYTYLFGAVGGWVGGWVGRTSLVRWVGKRFLNLSMAVRTAEVSST